MVAKVKLPPGAEWQITAELHDQQGNVLCRSVPLAWSAGFARDAVPATIGATFQGFLTSTINMAFQSTNRAYVGRRRRR